MIFTKKQDILICDWCGSKDDVRSYVMQTKNYDGHRNEYSDQSIELCKKCQIQALKLLISYGKEKVNKE